MPHPVRDVILAQEGLRLGTGRFFRSLPRLLTDGSQLVRCSGVGDVTRATAAAKCPKFALIELETRHPFTVLQCLVSQHGMPMSLVRSFVAVVVGGLSAWALCQCFVNSPAAKRIQSIPEYLQRVSEDPQAQFQNKSCVQCRGVPGTTVSSMPLECPTPAQFQTPPQSPRLLPENCQSVPGAPNPKFLVCRVGMLGTETTIGCNFNFKV